MYLISTRPAGFINDLTLKATGAADKV